MRVLMRGYCFYFYICSNDKPTHHLTSPMTCFSITILSTSPSSVCLMYSPTDLVNNALPSRTIISQVFPGGELPSQDCYPSFKLDVVPSLSIPATEVHHLN